MIIYGVNFTRTTAVYFGSKPSSKFLVLSDNVIGAYVPHGHGIVNVRIETPGGISSITSNDQFTYRPLEPRDFSLKQKKKKERGKKVTCNILSWKAPCNTNPVEYKIYRDSYLTNFAGKISANKTLRFVDKVYGERNYSTYYIVSVDSHGITSLPVMAEIK